MAIVREKGRVAFIGEVAQGTGASGFQWSRQEVVVEVEQGDGRSHLLAMKAMNDICYAVEKLKVGDRVEFSYAVNSRLYNGRYYTDVTLVNIALERAEAEGRAIESAMNASAAEAAEGDLPF